MGGGGSCLDEVSLDRKIVRKTISKSFFQQKNGYAPSFSPSCTFFLDVINLVLFQFHRGSLTCLTWGRVSRFPQTVAAVSRSVLIARYNDHPIGKKKNTLH